MAIRYSGSLTIRVLYNDRGFYNASISRKGRNLWSGTIGEPRHLRVAVDSPEAYDDTARAALSFAQHDGADVDDAGPEVTRKDPRIKFDYGLGIDYDSMQWRREWGQANPARKRPAAKRARKAVPRRR